MCDWIAGGETGGACAKAGWGEKQPVGPRTVDAVPKTASTVRGSQFQGWTDFRHRQEPQGQSPCLCGTRIWPEAKDVSVRPAY
jgi:hypothetical protein